jgi:hypothetical protein
MMTLTLTLTCWQRYDGLHANMGILCARDQSDGEYYRRSLVFPFLVKAHYYFVFLSVNPELQERLAVEISDTLKGEQPNYDNTKNKNLPLVNGFLMEVLRLW